MRPVKRPKKPFTAKNIPALAKRIYRHFITEGNPRCVNRVRQCLYGKTGCGVGCLLTQRDANQVDKYGGSTHDKTIRSCLVSVPQMQKYFDPNDKKLKEFLSEVQDAHDEVSADFEGAMKKVLRQYGVPGRKISDMSRRRTYSIWGRDIGGPNSIRRTISA